MYLSRVQIDSRNRLKIKDLTHLGAYHNWVEQSFPEKYSDGDRPRHLWRIDKLGDKKYLLVLSEEKPDLQKLEKYGVENTAETKNYDHYLDSITSNSTWKFKLTANPTYRIVDEKGSRIVPHITIDQQLNWLIDRSEKHGFKILTDSEQSTISVDIVARDWPILRKNRRVKLSRVTFEGILKVTDLDKFKTALTKGIGREKAYGMGLITVIPFKANNEQ
ncbi:type I-E CRISPR-associated protein Cas6/Cse3/CasE [Lactobacillus sp. PSON]|uniref:type I-E CRISPR-associated protein Cas6/Cse3/CasE n=1 Tax=Lactobacillus sp. PSON TaxID=3455454 RepID=UPI0040430670